MQQRFQLNAIGYECARIGYAARSYRQRERQAVTPRYCFALIRAAISRLLCFSNTISDGVSILGAFEVASF